MAKLNSNILWLTIFQRALGTTILIIKINFKNIFIILSKVSEKVTDNTYFKEDIFTLIILTENTLFYDKYSYCTLKNTLIEVWVN